MMSLNEKENREVNVGEMESMLRLDQADEGGKEGLEEEQDEEGDDRILNKLADEDKHDAVDAASMAISIDQQKNETHKVLEGNRLEEGGEGGEEEEEGEERDKDDMGNGLLASLATDIEKYQKKVQLKKHLEDSVGKEIIENLNKERKRKVEPENSEKEILIDDIEDEEEGEEGGDEENDSDSKRKKRKLDGKKHVKWTKAENDAVVYYKEELKYSWKRIAKMLDNRHTWQSIQMRYLRNYKSRNEEWSKYMETRLIDAIRKDWENRWFRVAKSLGKDFTAERCMSKNIEICKKVDTPYYSSIFEKKDIQVGYENPNNDIRDEEAHKKLMLVYMGLDSISYEDELQDKGAEEATTDNSVSSTTQQSRNTESSQKVTDPTDSTESTVMLSAKQVDGEHSGEPQVSVGLIEGDSGTKHQQDE